MGHLSVRLLARVVVKFVQMKLFRSACSPSSSLTGSIVCTGVMPILSRMVMSLRDTLHVGKLADTGSGGVVVVVVVAVVVVVVVLTPTLTDKVMFKEVMLMEAEPDLEVMIEEVVKANWPEQLAPIPVMPRFKVVACRGEYDDGKPVMVKSLQTKLLRQSLSSEDACTVAKFLAKELSRKN